MGAKSTMDITRADALNEILRHITLATDEGLGDILETLVGDQKLLNFRIVLHTTGGSSRHDYSPGCLD